MLRSYQTLLNRILILLDAMTVGLSFYLAWTIKFKTGWFNSVESVTPQEYALLGGFVVIVYVLTNSLFGLYSSHRTSRMRTILSQIMKSCAVAVLILMSVLFFVKEIHASRSMLAMFIGLSLCLLTLERMGLRVLLREARTHGYNKKFMLIVGAGELGRRVLKLMKEHREFGFDVVGFLDDRLYPSTSTVDGIAVLGTIDSLERQLTERIIDQVVIALPIGAHPRMGQVIMTCEKVGVQAMIIPDYFGYLPARPRFEEIGGIPMIDVRYVPLDDVMNAGLKRTFDIVFSLAALLLFAPLLALIALLVKLSSRGPVFFAQERVGKNRRTFAMYKFRTMKVGTDEVAATQWTTAGDPRKTKIGAFLRKTSLDELPQFYNVLRGDMSIVGPRPERPYFVDQFKEDIPKYMVKHRVRPGITGWAQVNGWRGDTSIEERIKCDIDYIENWTFSLDLKIAIKTVINGFVNKNAY